MPSSSLLFTFGAGLLFLSVFARAQDGIVDDTSAGNDVGSAGEVGGAESHDFTESGDSGALGNDLPFARAAVFGHAAMSAGKKPASASDHEGAASMLPPFEDFFNPPQVQNKPLPVFGHDLIPSSHRPSLTPAGPTAADINLALAGLNQAAMILESLAANGCGGNCDLSAFPNCICANFLTYRSHSLT